MIPPEPSKKTPQTICEINGRRFFDGTLKLNLDDQLKRVEDNWPSCIIVDGGSGAGKTHSDVQIADYLSIQLGQGNIILKDQLARGNDEFFKKLDLCIANKRRVLVYDEAGDFSKRRALSKINLNVNRIFEQYRQFKIMVIVSLPLADNLDNLLMYNQIPRLILHLDKRFKPHVEGRAYSLKRFYQVKGIMEKLWQKNFAYNSVPFNFHFRIYELPPDRKKEVDEYSILGKIKNVKHTILSNDNLLNVKEMANRLNRSVIWCKKKLALDKLKESESYKGKKYYSEEVFNHLQQLRR